MVRNLPRAFLVNRFILLESYQIRPINNKFECIEANLFKNWMSKLKFFQIYHFLRLLSQRKSHLKVVDDLPHLVL